MRFMRSVLFTCACGVVLGAASGLMAGIILSALVVSALSSGGSNDGILAVLLIPVCALAGAVIGGIYSWKLIRESPDEWITPTIQCKSCDYDLTRNQSGVCPECGMAITDAQKKLITNNSEPNHA